MEGSSSGKKKGASRSQDHGFAELIFSWSLDDIVNDGLYEHQVKKIPLTFQSEEHYFRSFDYPLLEETRTELASTMKMMYRAPFAEISSLRKAKGKEKMMYDVTVGDWRNSERRKEPYRTLPGDLLILANGEPGSVSDLQSNKWAFLLVNNTEDDDGTPVQFKVTASQEIEIHDGMFVVFLMNITTQKRIWNSLHKHANLHIIKEILYPDSMVKEKCDECSLGCNSAIQRFDPSLVSKLNESQKAAIMAAIRKMDCSHKSSVEQIWGPPGTGKTMTVSVMLSIFLQMKCRTLTCAPTNVAIVAVASRVLSLVKESSKTITANGDLFYSVGDLLLFGNKDRLKIGTNIEEIYLDHRVEKLIECLGSLTGWKHCIKSMIDLLEDCVSQYHVFVENEKFKEEQLANENKSKTKNLKVKSFMEFLRERFSSLVQPLRRCIVTFCTHIPRSFMKQEVFQTMVSLLDNLSSLESLLSQKNLVSEELENIFVSKPLEDDFVNSGHMSSINSVRIMSLSLLRTLQTSLGGLKLPGGHREAIKRFCYERASLIFCTTSTSYQLQKFKIEPLKLLVIDEAAQMKECEAIIPLQIPGMRHAILIGDECQLPATVKSNVSSECGLGRSLFERLSSLGQSKHLLNVQYRMHPKISSFPNLKFYHNQILDAENVSRKNYRKEYLSGSMFGSYSFINIVGGKEEGDDVGSKRNMVEMSIVVKIVQKLHKAWHQSKKKVSIGVVSPYTAQVVAIEEKLRYKYEKLDGFSVTVKSIDGFQGGEEDIIILSTVRSNSHGSVGFISSPQRTNVALTRARHCLWILGNERTLARSDSIWKDLVCDAKNRNCLFDADADKCLKKIIIDAKKVLEPLNDMVKGNSLLVKHVKWKVLFSDNFRMSFGKLMDSRMKNLVVDLLQKLSGGWRPNDGKVDSKTLSKVLKTFMIEGLHVIWTTDIMKETKYVQVLKVWDILPLKEIPKLRKELESIFSAYSDDYMNRCTTKHLEGNLEIPKSWLASQEIVQFQKGSNCEFSESLLHMKFYSLSTGMVNHLRFGKDIDLPMQLSDEQMDVFLCSKSSFIFGPLRTGKTTILTMKLLQKEESFRDAKVVDVHEESKPTVLRQLFVTVNPKSCYAVKQQVSHLKSFSCDGKSSSETNLLDDADFKSESNVPDTFIDIPEKSYPLVITFQKFVMMLDGTLGNSFFERFHEAREGSHGDHISSRSVALQTFIRLRNVTFDRFCSLYWPHFDSNLTKKLDPSRVFIEIAYHIKGGLQAGQSCHGYSLLSEGCASTLTKQKREIVNTLFQAYEKLKTERDEFDLGDLVNDLHHRLKSRKYEGDVMDFVYIDDVHDLSMKQISLFKHICQNVDEGFTFAGDTVQNIARGIDCRLEDIRSLLYTEFLGSRTSGKKEKVDVSQIFQLKSRNHDGGVLKLGQSVIDILYCYFAHSIDILEPETSLIYGEAPVLLKSANDENAIMKIFGGTGTRNENVGFGAEQVILVRDDYTKNEICENVGNHALILTIEECRGLEFQDVLLYNFFGSSPLEDQWSVIYGYMKEHDWLDAKIPHSFPSFKESKHNVLCSELKQLYVAITRTRQRLWILENKEELSKPMFDYWKSKCLIKVRNFNESVVQEMQCASSPHEWLERGKKLFYEKIFVMATMCFEKAGDRKWEKMAKACGLRTSADKIRETNPETASCHLREAAEMFESIGKHEAAISCYCDLGEFETAGKFYLEKCGEIDAAAECFRLTGCYTDAAEAYATGNQFSNCLSLCIKGELFEKGLQYIEDWKKHGLIPSDEIEQIEQEFLESCALSHYEHKDPQSMMNFVREFCSMESKRNFLRSLGCLDDLMVLEEESGHFLDAAELAGSRGDVLKEANFLEKAGCYDEATLLILWYVFCTSLWGNKNTGWPLQQFAQKKELCKKAESLTKNHSRNLHGFVCSEVQVLTKCPNRLSSLKKQLDTSQKHKSLRGEFLSIRKILDAHLQLNILKYGWEDELPVDFSKFIEDKVSQNHVSVRTLVFYFNMWKEKVMDLFKSLGSIENAEQNELEDHVDFILNYFGVRKQCVNGKIVYLLVNKDFDWVRNAEILTLDGKQLVHVMRSYWQSELLSVGLKVLETIQLLYDLSLARSAFHQSTSLLHMFEVSKFLLDCRYLDHTFHHTNSLQDFLESSRGYLDFVIPLDWRRSIRKNLISLRDTELSLHLVEEVILHHPNIELDFTHRTIGRLMMICLSSKKSVSVYEKIIGGLQWNPLWSSFFEKFWKYGFNDVYVALALQNALEETYQADRWLPGYMSPHSFVYLLDRLLFMTSFSYGFFFTTKSSFVEWYTSTLDTTLSASEQMFSKDIVDFVVGIVQDILYKKEETISWIEGSNIDASYYHPLIALKLVMIVALVSLQLSDCSQVLIDLLLGPNNVAYLLPKFVADLVRRRNGSNLNLNPDVVAEAFASIEDPLLIVSSKDETPKVHAPCAIFVDLRIPTKEMMTLLFPSALGIVLSDGQPCVSADTTLQEAKNSCNDLTILHKTKNSWDDNGLTTPNESNNSWDDMKHPSFAFDVSRPGVELSISTSGKMEETDAEHNNDHHSPSNLVLEKESNNLNTFATVLVVDGQNSAEEETTLQQETNTACNDLQQPSSASDKSRPEVDFGGRPGYHVEETGDELIKGDHSPVKLEVEKQKSNNNTQDLGIKTGMGNSRRKRSKRNSRNTLATVLLSGQSRAREDTTLLETSNSWDDMKLPSFASYMSHHEEEKCDDEHINGGQSLLEKQTTINSTHEAEIKKRKGNNMGRRINKNEGSKIPSTFTGVGHRNGDQSSAKLVIEKQTNNDKMKIKNIKVKNMEKCINEKQTNNQKMKIKIDKGKNTEKYINEKQANNEKMKIKKEKGMNMGTCINEKQTNNEKMKIKKEKGKNMEKCITEKKKCSSILDTSTRGELINDLSSVELVLEKQNSNKNSKDVEITKGKGKNMEKWIKTNKESNCINTFTSEEHRDDDHSLVQSVAVKQSINTNTGDKFKKKKGIKSSATTSISDLVDVQHYAGEDATPQEEKCACNDMKQHSLASDISLERSNITKEVLQEENHVKETNDEHKIGDHLPLELLLEKQNNNNITQNEENEKGKGKFVAGEDTTMCEANNACNDLNSPSSSFDMGTKATEGIKYGSILDAAVTFLGIRSWRKL